jgi:hypothetical protein
MKDNYIFETLPDGKYIVRWVRETISEGNFILGIYQISYGEFQGKLVQMLFDSVTAKKITREYTGMFLERLAFEGNKKAYDWHNAQLNSDGEYIVNIKNSQVSSIPEPDADKMERLMKRQPPHSG